MLTPHNTWLHFVYLRVATIMRRRATNTRRAQRHYAARLCRHRRALINCYLPSVVYAPRRASRHATTSTIIN